MTVTSACWACGEQASRAPEAFAPEALRCPACGLEFAPQDAGATTTSYGDAYFDRYTEGGYVASEQTRRHESRVRLAWMAHVGVVPPGRLLEVGSAAGFFLDEAESIGWRAEGIEPAAGMVERARRELGVQIQLGSIGELDLPEERYDVACLWHTLEHIPEPLAAVKRIAASLRAEARIVVEVPNAASRMHQRLGRAWPPLQPDVHVAQYTPVSLCALLERAGLTVRHTETVPFLTYVAGASRRVPRRVLLSLRHRGIFREPHPDAHELLRAVANRKHTE